jgi:hypothetical protein
MEKKGSYLFKRGQMVKVSVAVVAVTDFCSRKLRSYRRCADLARLRSYCHQDVKGESNYLLSRQKEREGGRNSEETERTRSANYTTEARRDNKRGDTCEKNREAQRN